LGGRNLWGNLRQGQILVGGDPFQDSLIIGTWVLKTFVFPPNSRWGGPFLGFNPGFYTTQKKTFWGSPKKVGFNLRVQVQVNLRETQGDFPGIGFPFGSTFGGFKGFQGLPFGAPFLRAHLPLGVWGGNLGKRLFQKKFGGQGGLERRFDFNKGGSYFSKVSS